MTRRPCTIISDDCWGAEFYRQMRIPYRTPTVGLWIEPRTYIDFVVNLRKTDASKLKFVASSSSYPMGITPYAELHFLHYHDGPEAEKKFQRRFIRMDFSRLRVKIDFGKAGYTSSDVLRWNSLRLPNSVAFYRRNTPAADLGVHNGVLVDDWNPNGALMFNITRKYFDVYRWCESGIVESGRRYLVLNVMLLDPTAPRRMIQQVWSWCQSCSR
jgi:uncharacterized protein (DUF1919 family)